MTGSAGFTHYKPQAGEPAPPHRYPLLLALAAVAILVALVGLFTAGWLVVTAAIVAVAALAALRPRSLAHPRSGMAAVHRSVDDRCAGAEPRARRR